MIRCELYGRWTRFSFGKVNFLGAVLTLMVLGQGCSSTDIIGEGSDVEVSRDAITLSLSAPRLESRADASHRLRYTARLFRGNVDKAGETIEFVEKKQMAEGDVQSTLVFEGVEPGTYTLILFADYIPASASADADGAYPDTYYTTTDNEVVKMRKVDSGIINSENYDCFGKYIVVTKEAEELRRTVTLPRIVSKVRVIGNMPEGTPVAEGVSVTRFSTFMNYNLITGSASNPYNNPTSAVSEGKWDFAPSDASNGELFYFYTFATSGYKEYLGHLYFTVNSPGLESVSTTIETGKVEVRQNYITSVRGDFIPVPAQDPVTRTDRILLDLSALTGWGE